MVLIKKRKRKKSQGFRSRDKKILSSKRRKKRKNINVTS